MTVDYHNPKVWAVGAGLVFAVWYLFFHKSAPSSSVSTPGSSALQTTTPNPTVAPGSSGEAGSGGADPQITGGLLSTLGQVVDSLLGSQVNLANYASTTTGQVFQYAQSSNQQFGDITRSVLANPPTITNTIYYPTGDVPSTSVGSGGGGNTSGQGGGTPAPYVPPAQTFTPSYSAPGSSSAGLFSNAVAAALFNVSAGPVAAPVVPANHGKGLGGPQA